MGQLLKYFFLLQTYFVISREECRHFAFNRICQWPNVVSKSTFLSFSILPNLACCSYCCSKFAMAG